MVKEFHEKFGHPIGVPFTWREVTLRDNLIDEEIQEVYNEMFPQWEEYSPQPSREEQMAAIDKVALTKELCDLLYVVLGTGVTFGLPLKEAFEEVHRSNMSKLGEDGKPVLRADGKVLKGSNYTPANLEKLF